MENSDNSALRELADEEKGVADYSDGVPVAKYKNKPGYLKIQIKPVTVIGMFGPSGSGKTTGGVSIASRAADQGRTLINVGDSDFQFNNFDNNGGVSQGLIDAMGLYENERPREIENEVMVPKFLYKMMDSPPTFATPFSFGFHQLSQSELKFLLSRGTDTKKTQLIQMVLNDIDIDKTTSFQDIRDAFEEEDNIHHNTMDSINRQIDIIESGDLVSSRRSGKTQDILKHVRQGKAFAVGMKNFDILLNEDDYWKAEFYAAKVLRMVIEDKLNGELSDPLMGILPEAHHLAPRNEDSRLTNLLKRNFTYYKRRTDMPFIIDTQSPSQIPGRGDSKNILGELNHAFIGRDEEGKSLDPKDLKKVLTSMNIITDAKSNEISDWNERVKDIQHREFLYVNPRMDSPLEAPVVEFLAPLVSNP